MFVVGGGGSAGAEDLKAALEAEKAERIAGDNADREYFDSSITTVSKEQIDKLFDENK